MNRIFLCLCLLFGFVSLGCIDQDFAASHWEERDLFDLPPSPTPEAKQVFSRPANLYRDYQQHNYELILSSDQPGYSGRQFKVLIPAVPSKTSLPCLFYNPPGSTAFNGKSAGTAEIDPLLPYVSAGFAVVIYGTDGGTLKIDERTSLKSLSAQADKYAKAHAGLINARYAIDVALREFPQIDPHRLYTVGHSSGGKQALLVAASDKRIAGCVAWAPGCSVSREESKLLESLAKIKRNLPVSVLTQSNPMLFAKRIDVPVLLVHSASDEVVPSADVIQFGELVGGADVHAVRSQSHFDLPGEAFELTERWLTRLATANGERMVRAGTAHSATGYSANSHSTPTVRPLSNAGSRRPSATRVQHAPRGTPTINTNPFAN